MRPVVRLLALPLLVAAAMPASAAAQAWQPREATPAGTTSSRAWPQLLGDGSAVWTVDAVQDGVRRRNLVARPAGGPAVLQAPYGGGFGADSGSVTLTAPAADGTYFAYRNSSPLGVMRLGRGTDPASAPVEPTAQVLAMDVAPTGEAVALQRASTGSALAVAFRPAGPDGRFDTPRRLPLGGANRAYAIGITLDPDGGVFVLYKTEQPVSVLSTYAPPGGDFAVPTRVDIANADPDAVAYSMSTNGHVLASWAAPPADDSTTNSTRVLAAVRKPGAATLDTPKLLLSRTRDFVVGQSAFGITDDGTAYVGLFDGQPVTGCSGNEDSGRTAYLAVRGGLSPDWTVTATGGGAWPERAEYSNIATAGNRVGLAMFSSRDQGTRCQRDTRADLKYSVALGSGTAIGSPTVLLDRPGTAPYTYPYSAGLAVDATGRALLLTSESAPVQGLFAYANDTGSSAPPADPGPGADPGPATDPGAGSGTGTSVPPGLPPAVVTPPTIRPVGPAPAPLPPPGRVTFSKDFAVVKDATVTFKAGCAAASAGIVDVCKTRVLLRTRQSANVTAVAAKQPPLIGSAKASIPAGKTRRIRVKLNRAGRKALKQRKRLPVTLTVTVSRGARTTKVVKRVTLRR